jgi:nitroreductase
MIEKLKNLFQKKINLYDVKDKKYLLTRNIQILGHRIDKSLINKKSNNKYNEYIILLKKYIVDLDRLEPENKMSEWALNLIDCYEKNKPLLVESVISKNNCNEFINISEKRYSCRRWNDKQNFDLLNKLAIEALKIGVQTPTSSNRQPWRFLLLSRDDLKVFKGLKEVHVINAPYAIFIGMDTRVYKYDENRNDYSKEQIYLDAGASIMAMIYYLEFNNINTCWNHLGSDLIASRKKNIEIYNKACLAFNISSYIEPVALLVFGKNAEITNTKPIRKEVDYYIIEKDSNE